MTVEQLLTAGDVATLCKVNKSTVYRWVSDELIACVRLGRSVRFRETDVKAFTTAARKVPQL